MCDDEEVASSQQAAHRHPRATEPAAPSAKEEVERSKRHTQTHLWQFGYDFAELMIRDELPESQRLVGAVHQLLDALQGGFLVSLSLGCRVGEQKMQKAAMTTSHNHFVCAFSSSLLTVIFPLQLLLDLLGVGTIRAHESQQPLLQVGRGSETKLWRGRGGRGFFHGGMREKLTQEFVTLLQVFRKPEDNTSFILISGLPCSAERRRTELGVFV